MGCGLTLVISGHGDKINVLHALIGIVRTRGRKVEWLRVAQPRGASEVIRYAPREQINTQEMK